MKEDKNKRADVSLRVSRGGLRQVHCIKSMDGFAGRFGQPCNIHEGQGGMNDAEYENMKIVGTSKIDLELLI